MKSFLLRWLGVSLILHIVTAWFSVGYHSADEQFQILEFLSYKLGAAPQSVLAVEFPERMRPWLQPGIYYAMTRFWQLLGIESFSWWAFSYRLFAGIAGWLSIAGLSLAARAWLREEKHWRFCVRALCLLWFLPALHVRPSSESLGGSAFLIGLCLLVIAAEPWVLKLSTAKENPQEFSRISAPLLIAAGSFFGLSFESRFQMALMIVGTGAWVLFVSGRFHQRLRTWRVRLGWLGGLLLGFTLIFALGRIVDHWGYGDWSFSPWNYFSYNLVRGEVSRYGRSPWWDLFRMAFTESWPFLGLAVALSAIAAWLLFPLHALTWSQVPFFLVHEMIAHKELRFFFPIAAGAPVLLALLYAFGDGWRARSRRMRTPLKLGWYFLLGNNFAALLVLTFLPFARTVQFYEGVERIIPKQGVQELWAGARDPYEVLGTPIYFYRPKNLAIRRFSSYAEAQARLHGAPTPFYLFHPGFELGHEAQGLLPLCKPVYRTLPSWVRSVNFTNWLARTNVWSLYRCGQGVITGRF